MAKPAPVPTEQHRAVPGRGARILLASSCLPNGSCPSPVAGRACSRPLQTLADRLHVPARRPPALFVWAAIALRSPSAALHPPGEAGTGCVSPLFPLRPHRKERSRPADKPRMSLLSFILRTLIFSFICPSCMSVQNWSSAGASITSTGIQAAGLRLAGAPLALAKQQLAGKKNPEATSPKKQPPQQSTESLPPAPAFGEKLKKKKTTQEKKKTKKIGAGLGGGTTLPLPLPALRWLPARAAPAPA